MAKLNLARGFFRLTLVVSIIIGIVLGFLAFLYSDSSIKSFAWFIIGVVSVWGIYFVLRFVFLGFVTKESQQTEKEDTNNTV